MIRRALLGLALLLVFSFHLAFADGPVSLADYRAAVHAARGLVERAQAEPNPEVRGQLYGDALARLQSIEVEMSPGVTLRVANDSIVADLQEASRHPLGVYSSLPPRLAALEAALAAPLTEPDAADRAKLKEIYSRPPFAQADNPLSRFQQALNDWLDSVLSSVGRGIIDWREGIALVGGVAVLLAVIFLLVILWRNTASSARAKKQAPQDAPLTAASALALARQSADAGDYRSAVRELYLATLLLLEERGLLHYDRALTNREYLDLVKGAPAVHDALVPVVQTFDRIWYGYDNMQREDFEAFRRQVNTVRDL